MLQTLAFVTEIPLMSLISIAGTTFALPAITPETRIVKSERVAALARSLPRIDGRDSIAAQGVDSAGDGFKVGGVYAQGIGTEMIQGESIGNLSYQQFVCKPVNTKGTGNREVPVAIRGHVPLPCPAGVALMYFAPKESKMGRGKTGRIKIHRKVTPFGVMQPVVLRHAAALILSHDCSTRAILA